MQIWGPVKPSLDNDYYIEIREACKFKAKANIKCLGQVNVEWIFYERYYSIRQNLNNIWSQQNLIAADSQSFEHIHMSKQLSPDIS